MHKLLFHRKKNYSITMLEQMGFNIEDAKQISLNTIESTFLTQVEKEELKKFVKKKD